MENPNSISIKIEGIEYFFIEFVENFNGSDHFILCKSDSGQKKCVERTKWEAFSIECDDFRPQENSDKNLTHSVSAGSSKEQKLELFKSLFRGREDAFAESYFSKKRGKLEYVPACSLKWKRPLAPGRRACLGMPH